MEYYSALNRKEAMNFAQKWVQVEEIMFHEITDPGTQMSPAVPHLSLLAPNLQM